MGTTLPILLEKNLAYNSILVNIKANFEFYFTATDFN